MWADIKETRIYENINSKEKLKNIKTTEAKYLSEKLEKLEKRLSKLANKKEIDNFLVKNLNDYLKWIYWCELKNINNQLVLIVDESHKKSLKDLNTKLNIKINNKWTEIFLDDDKNNKMWKYEIWVKIDKNWAISNSIYVSTKETESNKINYILWNDIWEIVYRNWNTYYKVKNWKWIKINMFLWAISTEYLNWMNNNEIKNNIKTLWYKKENWIYKFTYLKNWEKNWYKLIENDRDKIFKTWEIIDISSLSNAIKKETVNTNYTKKHKETIKNSNRWWRTYFDWNQEIWDIPDNMAIDYEWYTWVYNNLKWNQISIWAKWKYDFSNDKFWKRWNNSFAIKKEIKLYDWTSAYLIAWEIPLSKFSIDLSSIEWIKKSFEWKYTEARLAKKTKNGMKIIEVWDKNAHTITETNDKVERWKDKNHPIILESNKYSFYWKFKWEITFDINKDWKTININNIWDEITKDNFESIFWAKKVYFNVKDKLLELKINEKDWKLDCNILWNYTKEKTNIMWLDIYLWNLIWININRNLNILSFSEMIWWWKISWQLDKDKKWNVIFKLDDNYKINKKNIIITLPSKKKLNASDIQETAIKWLLLLYYKLVKKHKDFDTLYIDNYNYVISPNKEKNISWKEYEKILKSIYDKEEYKQFYNKDKKFIFNKIKNEIENISENNNID